jgi:hypothetical protein
MRHKRLTPLALGLIALTATAGFLNAAPGAREMGWWTVDAGGGTLSAGAYGLSGTVGQAEVGPALEYGPYRLVGGYWYGVGEEQPYELYLPSVLRDG